MIEMLDSSYPSGQTMFIEFFRRSQGQSFGKAGGMVRTPIPNGLATGSGKKYLSQQLVTVTNSL